MPLYIIYHRSLLTGKHREQLASNLTDLHAEVTGAPRSSVRIIFHQLDDFAFFAAGQRASRYVRIIAQIRGGRSREQKTGLLRGMFELAGEAKWTPDVEEIQTQIVEIDDTESVMTNGVLNALDDGVGGKEP